MNCVAATSHNVKTAQTLSYMNYVVYRWWMNMEHPWNSHRTRHTFILKLQEHRRIYTFSEEKKL